MRMEDLVAAVFPNVSCLSPLFLCPQPWYCSLLEGAFLFPYQLMLVSQMKSGSQWVVLAVSLGRF